MVSMYCQVFVLTSSSCIASHCFIIPDSSSSLPWPRYDLSERYTMGLNCSFAFFTTTAIALAVYLQTTSDSIAGGDAGGRVEFHYYVRRVVYMILSNSILFLLLRAGR